MWALHEIEGANQALREAHRALRAGGGIVIVDFPADSLAQRLWNEDDYAPDEVARMLREAGFDEVRVKPIERGQVLWATGFRAAREPAVR